MAINTGQHTRPYSVPHIDNQSFDPEFQVKVTEVLGYNPNTNSLERLVTTGGINKVYSQNTFNTNEIDNSTTANTLYIGKEDPDGNWYLKRFTQSTNLSFEHATINNNPTITSYADAWDNRVVLNYGVFSEAF